MHWRSILTDCEQWRKLLLHATVSKGVWLFTNVWWLSQSSPKVQVQFCIFWGLIVNPILFKYFVLMSSSSFLLELKFPLGLLCCTVVESCRTQTCSFLWLAIWIYVACDNQPFFCVSLCLTLCVCIKATGLYNNCNQHSQTKEKENVLKLFFLSFFCPPPPPSFGQEGCLLDAFLNCFGVLFLYMTTVLVFWTKYLADLINMVIWYVCIILLPSLLTFFPSIFVGLQANTSRSNSSWSSRCHTAFTQSPIHAPGCCWSKLVWLLW